MLNRNHCPPRSHTWEMDYRAGYSRSPRGKELATERCSKCGKRRQFYTATGAPYYR